MTENQNIVEKGKSMFRYAMHYGVYLGLFWVFQYSLKIAADAGFSDRFKYLFYLLNVGTFLLIYFFSIRYKESEPKKKLSILRCVGFVMTICFFASFFEGAAIYAHFKFIDTAYFDKMATQLINVSDSIYDWIGGQNTEAMKESARQVYLNKFFYVLANVFERTLFGAFIGLIISVLISIRK